MRGSEGWRIWVGTAVICLALDSVLRVYGQGLNLTVIVAYAVGLRHGAERGIGTGALLGLLSDSLSGGMLGPAVLGKATAGYAATVLVGRVLMWSPALGVMALGLITVLDGVVSYACLLFFSETPPLPPGFALRVVLLQGCVNMLFGALVKPGR